MISEHEFFFIRSQVVRVDVALPDDVSGADQEDIFALTDHQLDVIFKSVVETQRAGLEFSDILEAHTHAIGVGEEGGHDEEGGAEKHGQHDQDHLPGRQVGQFLADEGLLDDRDFFNGLF
jgi:hypothetical protein